MIKKDQPTIFKDEIIAAVSSVSDGTMANWARQDGVSKDDVAKNQAQFFANHGVSPDQGTLVAVTYDTDDFARYREVQDSEKGDLSDAATADALVTVRPGHALFLPLADCVGAILFDPVKRVLMMSHLGRHSTEIYGAARSVQHLINMYDSNPADIVVWLSPAVGKETYPLTALEGKSLHEANREHLLSAGILPEHIEIAPAETAADDNYYSHSQYQKGRTEKHGRHAIVAMIP